MLYDALAWRGDSPVEERVMRLEQSLTAAGLQLPEALVLLAPLLNLPLPERYPPLALTPEAQRKKLLATMIAWLFGLARLRPTIVVLEDLQWVDPSTLELQGLLGEQGPRRRSCCSTPPGPSSGRRGRSSLIMPRSRSAASATGTCARWSTTLPRAPCSPSG
jgi:hypothetical protein